MSANTNRALALVKLKMELEKSFYLSLLSPESVPGVRSPAVTAEEDQIPPTRLMFT